MKEQQVDAVPLVADAQAPLPGNEGEVTAKFEKKVFQSKDQRFSRAFSEYSSFSPRNSRTSGSLISCSGSTSRTARTRVRGGGSPPCSATIGCARRIG